MFKHCAPVSGQLAAPWGRLKGLGIVLLVLLPQDWNAMPLSIAGCKSIGDIKKRHLFKSAFN